MLERCGRQDDDHHHRQRRLDDPVFPATNMIVGAARQFEVAGLTREHWSSAAPIRGIFRDAFQAAGLPYFNPHSLRSTLVHLGETRCKSPEDFKAWSQNLGHEGVLFAFDVLASPDCGGRLRLLATIEDWAVVEKILTHLGLPADPPQPWAARTPAWLLVAPGCARGSRSRRPRRRSLG